jgi:hypothetical protein
MPFSDQGEKMADLPVVKGPLRLGEITYGDILIRGDGTFWGKIHDPEIHARIAALVTTGLCDGLQLTCNLVPAVPISEKRNDA